MTTTKLATIALGVACVVAAVLLPQTAQYLTPVATFLLGGVLPEIGKAKS